MSQKIKTKLVLLCSDTGQGTNLQAIIDAIASGKINAEIVAVISDVSNSPAVERARKASLQTKIAPDKNSLWVLLLNLTFDFLCLSGWKQIIIDDVIGAYPNRILNLHPGLVPDSLTGSLKNPDGTEALWNRGMLGNKAVQNFLDKGATYAGSSVHFLTTDFDFGPVLGRTFEKIEAGDTVETLYSRLKKKEHELYTDVLVEITNG